MGQTTRRRIPARAVPGLPVANAATLLDILAQQQAATQPRLPGDARGGMMPASTMDEELVGEPSDWWAWGNTPVASLPRLDAQPMAEIGSGLARQPGRLLPALVAMSQLARRLYNGGAGLVEQLSTPLSMGSLALSAGGSLAGNAGYVGVGQAARAVEAALSAPAVAEGAHRVWTARSPEEAAAGAVELTGGALGMKAALGTGGFVPVRYNKTKTFETARRASAAGASLTEEAPEQFFQRRTGEPIFYGLNAGPSAEAGTDLVSVMNNATRRGALGEIMDDAARRQAATLDAWAVPSERYPEGLLPSLYERYGWREAKRVPYDTSYGPPSEALRAAWRQQGWRDGDPLPDVVYMRRVEGRGRASHAAPPARNTSSAGRRPPR